MDALFPPLDGTALFTTTCTMNHACVPNVRVTYVDAAPPARWGPRSTVVDPVLDALDHAAAYTRLHAAASRVSIIGGDGAARDAGGGGGRGGGGGSREQFQEKIPVPGVTHHLDPRELAHRGESSQEIREGHRGLEATRCPCQPLEVAVTTLRDIEPGEELCFSYISESLQPAARKHALREYGIESCDCPLCSPQAAW